MNVLNSLLDHSAPLAILTITGTDHHCPEEKGEISFERIHRASSHRMTTSSMEVHRQP